MPSDGGISSLSSSARARREGAEQFARRIHEWMLGWTCLGPGCDASTPHGFYCSAACREASSAHEREKRGRAA